MLNCDAYPFTPSYFYYYQPDYSNYACIPYDNYSSYLANSFATQLSLNDGCHSSASSITFFEREEEESRFPRVRRNRLKLRENTTLALEFDESRFDDEIRTTVMIKNIPNRLSQRLLFTLLDQHCAEENSNASGQGLPFSEYDFVYLPMDFSNGCNLGYAFINFTAAIAAQRIYRAMHGRKWAVFSSQKQCHICFARIQGKDALMEHFRRSSFKCTEETYLPALLSPPRNGTSVLTQPSAVGFRLP